MQLDIPEEGLKVVAITGLFPDGAAVWKPVGFLLPRKGKVILLLDKSFNPAGCYVEDNRRSSVILNLFSMNEIDKKDKKDFVPTLTPKPVIKPYKEAKTSSTSWEDMDDDIPF